jgi:hypothetical protein
MDESGLCGALLGGKAALVHGRKWVSSELNFYWAEFHLVPVIQVLSDRGGLLRRCNFPELHYWS